MPWLSFLFPRPTGLVAIAYHSKLLAAVQLGEGKARLRVLAAACEPLAGDAALPQALQRLGRHFPKRILALLALDHRQYQLLQVDLPPVDAAEMADAVRLQLRERLDFPVAESALGVIEIPADPAASFPRKTAYVAMARDEAMRPWFAAFRRSRFFMNTVDIPELAQHNYLELVGQEGRAAAILAVLADYTLLTIGPPHALCVTRHIDITSEQLATATPAGRTALFERMSLEVQRTLDSYERQFASWPVESLWLARFGDDDSLLGFLIESLYLPVKALQPAQLFSGTRTVRLDDPAWCAQYFLALGLALRGGGA